MCLPVAYRDNLGKNNIHFAKYAFSTVQNFEKCFVIVGDFTNFFDNLEHSYLKAMLCKVLGVERLPEDYFSVFKSITRFSSWDWKALVEAAGENICEPGIRTKLNKKERIITREQFQKNKTAIVKNKDKVGVPQGSPISAVLSNVYMIEFDEYVKRYVTNYGGTYMRYSDDFIIILPYNEKSEVGQHVDFIFSYVRSMKGLIDLQKEKTSCYIYEDGVVYNYTENKPDSISYLGFIFDGKKTRLRPRAITKYYYRMRRKAHTIGRHHWKSPKGKRISAKKLYSIYSKNDERQTFIDYAKKAKTILKPYGFRKKKDRFRTAPSSVRIFPFFDFVCSCTTRIKPNSQNAAGPPAAFLISTQRKTGQPMVDRFGGVSFQKRYFGEL